MLIHVTQSHIDRGCRGDGQACPVALALEEVFHCPCMVDRTLVVINMGPDSFSLPTPITVLEFIIRYDNGIRVRPFEFELDVEGVAT